MPTKPVNCPHCDVKLSLPSGNAGKRIRCPKCNEVFSAPAETEEQVLPARQAVALRANAPKRWAVHDDIVDEDDDTTRARSNSRRQHEGRSKGNLFLLWGLISGGGVAGLLVGAVVAIVLLANAGKGTSPTASPSPKHDVIAWKEFSHPEGKFTVLMPGTPQQMAQAAPTPVGKMKLTMNIVELPDEKKAFAVAFADYPPGPDYADDVLAEKVIDGNISGIARSMKAEVGKKSKIKLGSHRGQECLLPFTNNGKMQLIRVYLVGNRVYQLMSGWSPNDGDDSADAERFMDSFKVRD